MPEEKTYAPEMEWSKVVRVALVWVAIYAATIGLSLYLGSGLPLMLIGLPRLDGAWHRVMTDMKRVDAAILCNGGVLLRCSRFC
jgi:fatty acid desaturase